MRISSSASDANSAASTVVPPRNPANAGTQIQQPSTILQHCRIQQHRIGPDPKPIGRLSDRHTSAKQMIMRTLEVMKA